MAEIAMAMFAAAGTAVGSASTVATVLSGVATAASVMMGMQQASAYQMAGQAEARNMRLQAQSMELDGNAQALASEQRAIELRREALIRSAKMQVASAASGNEGGQQLENLLGGVDGDLRHALTIERTNRHQIMAGSKAQAEGARAGALAASRTGASRARAARVGAVVTGVQGTVDIFKRY